MKKQNFTQHAKTELLAKLPQDDCCRIAWLAAAIKSIGSLKLQKKKASLIFESDDFEYIKSIVYCIKKVYFVTVQAHLPKGKKKRDNFYTVKVPYGHTTTILKDTGIIEENADGLPEIRKGIKNEVVIKECCAKNFLKSMFISTGSANVPSKIIGKDDTIISNGKEYYLEFVLIDEPLAEALISLLENFSITAKMTERKEKFVVYIKESEAISNFFALLNANETVLYMQDIIVERLVNNNLNRQSNCEVANYDKIAIASSRQIVAITKIQDNIGLESLPEHLREVALLRLSYPTATLDFFVEKLNNKISKSGVNHRFRKIIAIADDINTHEEV